MLIRPNARNRRCYISIQRKTKKLRENAQKAQLQLRIHEKKPQKVLCATFFFSRKTKLMDECEASLFIQEKNATIFVQKFIFVTSL